MSDQEILEKAIRKAIDGGWNYQPLGEKYFPDYLSETSLISHIAITINDLRLYTVVFNHDFAKALWGNNIYFTTYADIFGSPVTKDNPKAIKGHSNGLPKWQYRLQQMVIADDPIKYLGENI